VEKRINGGLRFSDRGRQLSWQKIARRPPGGRPAIPSKSKKPAQGKSKTSWRQFNGYFCGQQTIEKLKRELASA
jgi:hypothetical protein